MDALKKWWWRIPGTLRKPIVFIVGSILVIASALTGWLPGPGGIPLFLLGIAILATEFEWAKRVRDEVLRSLQRFGLWFRTHKVLGTFLIMLAIAVFICISYLLYQRLNP